jgi:hypothetical protein
MPLQLIECGSDLTDLQTSGVGQSLEWRPVAEYGGHRQDVLRHGRKPAESHPDSGSDRIGKLSRKRLIQRLQRLRPRAGDAAQIETEGDCAEQLHRE